MIIGPIRRGGATTRVHPATGNRKLIIHIWTTFPHEEEEELGASEGFCFFLFLTFSSAADLLSGDTVVRLCSPPPSAQLFPAAVTDEREIWLDCFSLWLTDVSSNHPLRFSSPLVPPPPSPHANVWEETSEFVKHSQSSFSPLKLLDLHSSLLCPWPQLLLLLLFIGGRWGLKRRSDVFFSITNCASSSSNGIFKLPVCVCGDEKWAMLMSYWWCNPGGSDWRCCAWPPEDEGRKRGGASEINLDVVMSVEDGGVVMSHHMTSRMFLTKLLLDGGQFPRSFRLRLLGYKGVVSNDANS